ELVALAWAELLPIAEVGRDQSFFALGGDSLLATRLVARLQEAGVSGASLRGLFAAPTVAGFAAQLSMGSSAGVRSVLLADPGHCSIWRPGPCSTSGCCARASGPASASRSTTPSSTRSAR